MHWYSRIITGAILLTSLSVSAMAQSDVCLPQEPRETSDLARAEQLKLQNEARLIRENVRRDWEVRMFSVKNSIPESKLQALCIFRVEVVSQPALRMIQVRAPKELMAAVEDALKRMDVPEPQRRSVELTAYVLVASDRPDPRNMPVPAELQSVTSQLKNLLTNGNWYLGDTLVTRGFDSSRVSVGGKNSISAAVYIREGTPPSVNLTNLMAEANNTNFQTSVDVPVGSFVVIGKGSAAHGSVVLVIGVKILN